MVVFFHLDYTENTALCSLWELNFIVQLFVPAILMALVEPGSPSNVSIVFHLPVEIEKKTVNVVRNN